MKSCFKIAESDADPLHSTAICLDTIFSSAYQFHSDIISWISTMATLINWPLSQTSTTIDKIIRVRSAASMKHHIRGRNRPPLAPRTHQKSSTRYHLTSKKSLLIHCERKKALWHLNKEKTYHPTIMLPLQWIRDQRNNKNHVRTIRLAFNETRTPKVVSLMPRCQANELTKHTKPPLEPFHIWWRSKLFTSTL